MAPQKGRRCCSTVDRAADMTATESTRAAGIESGDAPTVAQSTHFDARDRLAGRLDDTTVQQAVTFEVTL